MGQMKDNTLPHLIFNPWGFIMNEQKINGNNDERRMRDIYRGSNSESHLRLDRLGFKIYFFIGVTFVLVVLVLVLVVRDKKISDGKVRQHIRYLKYKEMFKKEQDKNSDDMTKWSSNYSTRSMPAGNVIPPK